MSTLVTDSYAAALVTEPTAIANLIQDRQDRGIDHHDEVWEGVYFMAPAPNIEHQDLVGEILFILKLAIEPDSGRKVIPGTNITDRPDEWKKNYRVPDIIVFNPVTRVVGENGNWLDGAEFLVEIVSQRDRTREKIPFYAKVNTQELLIVDRDPWQLELHRLVDDKLVVVGASTLADPAWITSETVPLKMRLQPGETRPIIELAHTTSEKTWVI